MSKQQKKVKKTWKEDWQEAKREGIFSDAKEMARVKKKYKFGSFIDVLLSIAIFIIALVVVTWVRHW